MRPRVLNATQHLTKRSISNLRLVLVGALVAGLAVVLVLALSGGGASPHPRHAQLGPTTRRQANSVRRRSAVPQVALLHGALELDASRADAGLPRRPFASTSVWYAPIPADAPLDPSSRRLVATLVQQVATYGTGFDTTKWSTPVYIVPAGEPTVLVHKDPPRTAIANRPLQQAFSAVPIPPGARPAAGTDELMVIYQPSTDTMWESWHTRSESDGWNFEYGGRITGVSHNPGYYQRVVASNGAPLEQPQWGAAASGLPLLAGLITFRDLAAGVIDHVLEIALPEVRHGVVAWPAQRSDGQSNEPNAIPEGAHFRLDPKLNINSLHLPPLTRMIAFAAQRYGIIVRDRSGAVSMDGQIPTTPAERAVWAAATGGLLPYEVLRSFPWSHLQLVRMRLRPLPG